MLSSSFAFLKREAGQRCDAADFDGLKEPAVGSVDRGSFQRVAANGRREVGPEYHPGNLRISCRILLRLLAFLPGPGFRLLASQTLVSLLFGHSKSWPRGGECFP